MGDAGRSSSVGLGTHCYSPRATRTTPRTVHPALGSLRRCRNLAIAQTMALVSHGPSQIPGATTIAFPVKRHMPRMRAHDCHQLRLPHLWCFLMVSARWRRIPPTGGFFVGRIQGDADRRRQINNHYGPGHPSATPWASRSWRTASAPGERRLAAKDQPAQQPPPLRARRRRHWHWTAEAPEAALS